MDPQAFPIAQSVINWGHYLTMMQKATGISLTRSLDRANMPADNLAAFIVTLNELKGDVDSALDALRNSGPFLHHLSVSFVVIAESQTMRDLLEGVDLHVTIGETLKSGVEIAVVSGNLSQWRNAVIDGCSEGTSYGLRALMGKCMLYFEQAGLHHLWAFFKKTTMHDSTFKLLPKV